MFRQSYDYRILVVICILLSIYVCSLRRENASPPGDTKDVEHYFLRWNGANPEIVETAPTDKGLLIPAEFRPIFFESIPVNHAGSDLLETIPGIGPHMAARIVATREDIGPFNTPESLMMVPGIGLKRKEYLKHHLSFAQ